MNERVNRAIETIHASCVSISNRAVLILGPPRSGKSALALALMAMGAELVADDQTCLWRKERVLMADVPDAIRGRIEARNIGILAADAAGPTPVTLAVDLGLIESCRLPPRRHLTIQNVSVALVHGPMRYGLAAAIRQLLLAGRLD